MSQASHTEQELIETYLTFYRTKNEEYVWAWETVDAMRFPKHLPFILSLLKACRDDGEIAYVAAGPLKDLFDKYHLEIKEELIVLVRQHACMRKAVQAFLLSPDSPEKKTLDEILQKFGLRYASL